MDKREVVFIDANIFLEVILKDEKNESCKNYLNKIKNNEVMAITSDFIIYTCLLQIERNIKDNEKLKKFILGINSLNGLEIIRPYLKLFYLVT